MSSENGPRTRTTHSIRLHGHHLPAWYGKNDARRIDANFALAPISPMSSDEKANTVLCSNALHLQHSHLSSKLYGLKHGYLRAVTVGGAHQIVGMSVQVRTLSDHASPYCERRALRKFGEVHVWASDTRRRQMTISMLNSRIGTT
jgi:hypothetical protein